MRSLHALLGAVGAVVIVGSLTLDRPGVFAVLAPCALLLVVVGAGSLAADAVPPRPLPATCSAITALLGLLLLTRPAQSWALGVAVVLLQVLPTAARPPLEAPLV